VRLKPTHTFVIGATQKGKTFYCNERHRTWPKISVFVDTKGIDPIWGAKMRDLSVLERHLFNGHDKLVYDPPRGPAGINWDLARPQLLSFWQKVQAKARKHKWSGDRKPWVQLELDEAQVWLDECGDIIEDMCARGLGMGLVVVLITQHPAGLNGKLGTRIRNNLDTRVVFGLGDEGRRCIQSWQWPVEAITAWTQHPYHFATNDPKRGWLGHCPIGGRACDLHRGVQTPVPLA
jgi:hypothetical protein